MKAWFYTNKGPGRDENQDGLYLDGEAFTDLDAPEARSYASALGLFAVVDGMGGMGGGDRARDIVLENLHGVAEPQGLERAFADLARIMRRDGRENPQWAHIGATIAGVWLLPEKAIAFNCGDCRVYQIRSGYLERLTHDHSLVQQLVDDGALAEEEMRFHPRKNIVTAAIMADDPDPPVFTKIARIKSGAAFLICSDGLWEALGNPEMEAQLAHGLAEAAKGLLEAALSAPARDNISFILLGLDDNNE